jgi:hypothetical protein
MCVHPDAGAATQLGANAFAAGRDIGFAPGRWQPGTHEGRRLLGHELAHGAGQARPARVQLDDATAPEAAKDAADVLAEGVKTVVEQAKENEGVKRSARPGQALRPRPVEPPRHRARRPR